MSMTERGYSLRWRLLLGTAGLMLGVLILLGLGVWQYANRTADLSYDRLLTGAALAIVEKIKSRNGQVEVDLPYAALEILELAPDDKVYYQVRGPDQRFLTGYRDFPEPPNDKPSDTPRFYNLSFLGESIRAVSVSKKLSDPGVSGWVEVRVGQSRLARRALSREILAGEILVLSLVMCLALACLAFGIHRTLIPLNRLSRSLYHRRADDLGPLPDTDIREVKPLVDAVDLYKTRLQASLDNMQLFIADASHQIRTALSGVQAQLDIAEVENDASSVGSRLDRIRSQHQHLTRLTNQLLTHAMVTHRRDTHQFQTVALDQLLSAILTAVVRDHAHTAHEFRYDNQAQDTALRVDAVSLREALRNLLDNAIKYGPQANLITLGARPVGARLEIYIEDCGPGIPSHLQMRAQQRFESLDQDAQSGGSGLGLAIAKTVIEAHGGTLTMCNCQPHGLRVTLTLPLESA